MNEAHRHGCWVKNVPHLERDSVCTCVLRHTLTQKFKVFLHLF